DDFAGLDLQIKYLCITMDDGYYSNYELGYPLFEKYRAAASVFAVTDYITEQTGVLKFTWEQAAEMEEGGWMKVYSHSADHLPVAPGKEIEFLESMQKSELALAENLTENHVKAMAYPNGRYTEESQRLLDEDGYVMQFTIENGVITANTERNAIPRITIESGMTGEDVIRKIELAAEKAFAAEREGKET
ncbi:MAG: polysaccharide deacetylase family protein, partial [Anaerotignum sp.]|nr:polysaccharide deacetylase family protein [Anaerotignum sp.]